MVPAAPVLRQALTLSGLFSREACLLLSRCRLTLREENQQFSTHCDKSCLCNTKVGRRV